MRPTDGPASGATLQRSPPALPAYDKKWAGVCAGLARYLDVDVTLIRIAVVAAFFCTGGLVLLAYIVASFIMPVDYGLPVPVSSEARATS
jgi:phage shock protein C